MTNLTAYGDEDQIGPARSTLFNLEPIGIGTVGVESLESYTCRLARRHGVARRSVEQRVNGHGPACYDDQSGPPRLDSPTDPAAEFGRRLALLTMRPEVVALGLGRFANRLATMSTLRTYRAWCGDCFCDARAASLPAHLPLVWSLAEYQRCLIHKQVLETQCSLCNKRSAASNSWSRALDHCPSCNKDLAIRRMGGKPTFAHLARRHDEDVDMFCAAVLGEFVAQASTSLLPAGPPDLARAVQSAIARDVATSPGFLALKSGLPRSTLHTIMKGRNRPSLVVLLRLSGAADVSMAGIFYPHLWRERVHGGAPPAFANAPRLRNNRKHNWDQIRRETAAALERGEAISLQRVSRDLGLDQSYFADRIGDIRHAIIERGREARKIKQAQRLMELTQMVRRTREELLAKGIRITARAIGKALDRPVHSPYMRQALKAAKD